MLERIKSAFRIVRRSAGGYAPSKDDPDFFVQGGSSASDVENCPAVSACVSLIATTLADLPWGVYRKEDGRYLPEPEHEGQMYLTDPNPSVDAYTFWLRLFRNLALHGNAYSFFRTGVGGRVDLALVEQDSVSLTSRQDGVEYSMIDYQVPGGFGSRMSVERAAALHLWAGELDPLTGFAADPCDGAVGTAAGLYMRTYETLYALLNNAFRSPAWVKFSSSQSKEKRDMIRDSLDRRTTGSKTGLTPLMPSDAELVSIPASSHEEKLNMVLQAQVQDIARAFGVPLPLIDTPKANYAALLNEYWTSFVQTTISRYVAQISSQLTRKIMSFDEMRNGYCIYAPTLTAETPNLEKLAQIANVLAGTGAVSTNEIRKVLHPLNLEDRDDGEDMPSTRGAPIREGSQTENTGSQSEEPDMDGGSNADNQDEN